MGSGRVEAVCDAGPLIHLQEIGCLPLLTIFDPLHIPGAVWSEVVGRRRVLEADILELGTIRRHVLPSHAITQFAAKNNLESLHAGERECLHLCQQMGVSVLLTDDLAVRDAAKHLQITPVGSLGGHC